jgi:hypothetical protein
MNRSRGPADRRFDLAACELLRPARDGVRGVTAAREIVNLEAPGSTPAEYPRPRIGMCSWESSESPKLVHRVRILASLLFVSDRLSSPWSVTESHATLRRSQTRFDSWRGHRAGPLVAAGSAGILPASVSEARRSSKPQGRVRFPGGGLAFSLKTRPRSVTDSHTTLRRSGTRFNSWRGHHSNRCFRSRSTDRRRWSQTARRPAATRFKWVRLPPASLGIAATRSPSHRVPAAGYLSTRLTRRRSRGFRRPRPRDATILSGSARHPGNST